MSQITCFKQLCKNIEEDTEDPALDKGNTLDVSEEMTSAAQKNKEIQVEIWLKTKRTSSYDNRLAMPPSA